MSSKYDWATIRSYYEAGHSAAECREHFNCSPGAWDRAITRGDIIPRPDRDPVRHSHQTRSRVKALLHAGMSQAQISVELGISKSTVAFHCRRLGIGPDPRFSRRYDWAQIRIAYERGLSMRECQARFGISRDAWAKAVSRGDIVPRDWVMPLSELLVAGRRTSRSHLKKRLLREGLKENRCERCGIAEWMGEPLNMHLHHVNGDGLDNRLVNLQMLCGNCHSQTDTYGGRNGHRRKPVATDVDSPTS